MRTNLSRFSVAFSDLSWESVIPDADIPIFPQARQVGEYLACYAERYVPAHVLRLGCRVIRTIRRVGGGGDPKWNVQWVQERYVGAHSRVAVLELDADYIARRKLLGYWMGYLLKIST